MKGAGNADGITILAIVILILLFVAGRISNSTTGSKTSKNTPSSSIVGNQSSPAKTIPASDYAKSVSISRGNASRVYQPYEEYITLTYRGKNTLNISGWQLRNTKDQRGYNINGSLSYFPADVAYIPKATSLLSPYGTNFLQDIVLKPGEKAIITTGTAGPQSPYKIVSFKETKCTGYLENLDEYKFTPALTRHCPRPGDEIGISALDTECRKAVERMSSCHTPEFETRDNDGNICHNCVDGKLLSNSCVAFIRSHFSYQGCIAYHAGDADFSGKTWRVYLGRGWEMWAEDYEAIKLFDQLGRLVIEDSY